MRMEARALAALPAIWLVNLMPVAAQQWPDKPVRILVPFPPGGGTDIQVRLLSVAFQKSMGQNFIVDKMNAESRKALDTPEVRAFTPREALDSVASSPEELSALLTREIEKYAKVIKLANIRLE